MANPFIASLSKLRRQGFAASGVILIGWLVSGYLGDLGQAVRLAMWQSLVNHGGDIVGFLITYSVLFIGILFLAIIFLLAYLDSRKYAPREEEHGISVILVFDELLEHGVDKRINILLSNNEVEEMTIRAEANAHFYAGFADTHWSQERYGNNLRYPEMRVPQKSRYTREIARTDVSKDGFWLTPRSDPVFSRRGYYIWRATFYGETAKSRMKFNVSVNGYFVYRGGTDLDLIDELPDGISFLSA